MFNLLESKNMCLKYIVTSGTVTIKNCSKGNSQYLKGIKHPSIPERNKTPLVLEWTRNRLPRGAVP